MKLRIFTFSTEELKTLFASSIQAELSVTTEYNKDDVILYVQSEDENKLKEFVECHSEIIFGTGEPLGSYKDLEV